MNFPLECKEFVISDTLKDIRAILMKARFGDDDITPDDAVRMLLGILFEDSGEFHYNILYSVVSDVIQHYRKETVIEDNMICLKKRPGYKYPLLMLDDDRMQLMAKLRTERIIGKATSS